MKKNLSPLFLLFFVISSCSTKTENRKNLTNNDQQHNTQIEAPAFKAKIPARGLPRAPYPSWDFFWGNEGKTKFNLYLDIDGSIKSIDIKESTASNSLNNSLKEWAYKNWKFLPCENENHKPIECFHEVTYLWKIENK